MPHSQWPRCVCIMPALMLLKSRWLLSQCHRDPKQKAKSNIEKANTNRQRQRCRWWLFINFRHAESQEGGRFLPKGGGWHEYILVERLESPPKPMVVSCNPGQSPRVSCARSSVGVCGLEFECVECVCLPKSAGVCSQVNNLLSAHNQRDSRNTYSHPQRWAGGGWWRSGDSGSPKERWGPDHFT